MEYYEGASYRINIEGYDSTLILDGYTRTLKANVIDQNDNMMVDHETGTLYGTLVGNIVDNESNVVYDSETKTITVEQIQGSLINTHGDIVYDHYQSIFKGDFIGNFSGNLLSGETVIYDQATNVLNASLFGSIMTAEGGIAYDHERNIFQGTFVGNFLDQDGNLIFSSSDATQNYNDNQILHKDGTIAVDLSNKVFSGSLWGNIVTQDGYVLLNVEDETLYGNVIGNLQYKDGTTAIDAETRSIKGNFVGAIYNDDGFLVLDNEAFLVNANLTGNVLAADGTIIVDTQTHIFNGTFAGSLAGDILNADGLVVFDNENAVFRIPVQADIIGTLYGDIVDADGGIVLNASEKLLRVNEIEASSITSTFLGTFLGDIVSLDGDVIYDSNTTEFAGKLIGDIVDAQGNVAYASDTKTFTGNFVGNFAGDIYTESLVIQTPASRFTVVNEHTIEDNGTVSVFSYSNNVEAPGGIVLSRGRGSIDSPVSVQAGDKIMSLIFAGVTENGGVPDFPVMAPVAIIDTEVDTAEIANNKLPGKISCRVFTTDPSENDDVLGWTVNSKGEFRATLADVTIVGETTKTPITTTPSKWLEIVVNGETCFMPLYT